MGVTNLEVFVEKMQYDVDGSGPFGPAMFEWPDNLAFDGEGNLWVLQDGGNNHIWVVAPTHTTAAPAIKVFANTPAGAEPTGITFSPDYRFMFISIQHPNASNTASQMDAAGNNVVFDAGTTLVIARKENLGVTALPVKFIKLNVTERNNGAEVSWTTAPLTEPITFEVERSTDGVSFSRIGRVASSLTNNTSYSYYDNNLPVASNVYYRLRECNRSYNCTYSDVKQIKITNQKPLKVYPQLTSNAIRVTYNAPNAADVLLIVYTNNGSDVYREKRKLTQGINDFSITIEDLPRGFYVLKLIDNGTSESCPFVK
jgi:hypothetical protein